VDDFRASLAEYPMDKWSLISRTGRATFFMFDDGVCPTRGASYNYNKPSPVGSPARTGLGTSPSATYCNLSIHLMECSYSAIILRTQRLQFHLVSGRELLAPRTGGGEDTYMPSAARVHEESLTDHWICAVPLKILSVS